MATVYDSLNFIRYIYSSKLLPRFKMLSKGMLVKGGVYCSSNVLFNFTRQADSAYCRLASSSTSSIPVFKIVLGGTLIRNVCGLPYNTSNRLVLKSAVDDIKMSTVALFFHEMGHLLYTDMTDTRILNYKDKDYINFIHSIHNIFEDVYLEKFGLRRDYPVTQKYFKFLTARVFISQAKSYSDDGSSQSFINYILLKLRCPKTLTAKNAVFDSVSKDILPMFSDILHDDDGTSRITKQIALAEWLIANTSLDFKTVTPPEEELPTGVGPGSGPAKPGKPETGAGGGVGSNAQNGAGDPTNRGGNRGSGDIEDNPTPEERPVFKSLDEMEQSLEDEDIVPTYNEENDIRVDDLQEIDDAFNSVLSIDAIGNHEWVIANKMFGFGPNVKEAVDKAMLDMNPIALQVIKSLKLFKGQIRPRNTAGFNSGKLHIPTAIKSVSSGLPTPYLFQRKIARGQAADLAISILCDNSGSMSGNKSHVCTRAMLALAQACDNVGIPIEVNCFTNGSTNYTIQMKSFEDKFADSKYYFGITDSDICYHYTFDSDIPVFCSNEDEVNLYNVWKRFLKNKHKDKLIFVISDGQTCGSSSDLRGLIQEIKQSGVKIIGLGIQSKAVASLYPEYKLFDTESSLQGLPDYLLETLNSLIRKD
jgi:hypothetical protein